MAIMSSYIFWVIVAAIIIVLALIGYLAEGTEFANKALNKKNSNLGKTDTGVVQADLPVEVLKVQDIPSAWTGDIPVVDERQETVHKVDSIDDWMNIPNVSEAPKVAKEDIQKAMNNSNSSADTQNSDVNATDEEKKDLERTSDDAQDIFDNSQEMFPDIKQDDLEPVVSPSTDNQDIDTETVWK